MRSNFLVHVHGLLLAISLVLMHHRKRTLDLRRVINLKHAVRWDESLWWWIEVHSRHSSVWVAVRNICKSSVSAYSPFGVLKTKSSDLHYSYSPIAQLPSPVPRSSTSLTPSPTGALKSSFSSWQSKILKHRCPASRHSNCCSSLGVQFWAVEA